MSIQAIAWVFKQPIKPSSLKFVLVAMADCANEKDEMRCWPSVDHICEVTSQDRKTVLSAVAELVRLGYLVDTQERKGRTKQIKIYRLNVNGRNSTTSGIVEESRSSVETVPKTDGKESRKRDTEPLIEPLENQASRNPNEGKASPDEIKGEVLPASWQDLAEARGIPDEQIFRSWRRFKDVTAFPYKLENWKAWIAKERVGGRAEFDG